MACWQCSHEMSGATRVVDSMVCLHLFFLLHAVHSTITCNGIELDQLLDNFLLAISFDALRNTGLQVPLQDDRLQFLKRLAHGVRLAQDIDAILILFHHFTYACNVSLDVRETLQYIPLSIILHLRSSFRFLAPCPPSRPNRLRPTELLPTVTDD